ncbi:MAG: MBL fold metallo-hydrolase [Candidatus Hodarchaeota archaeon]
MVDFVNIHYLGHASFIIQFDNGITILTDYGTSNAYDLDSPIHDFGIVKPDVITYSHKEHIDHNSGLIPNNNPPILTNSASLDIKEVRIEPIRTCERSLEEEDNTSYLFTYKGFKILHLGDAHAYIYNIDQKKVKECVKKLYPDTYDILLATIDGPKPMINEAEQFIDLLQPKRIVLMHYWSVKYKNKFLDHLNGLNKNMGRQYHIQRLKSPKYSVSTLNESVPPIQVISLEPAAFS